jgi:Ca-activated chloride channel family protein
MSPRIAVMTDTEVRDLPARGDAGPGALHTGRGNLPLESLDLRARITGLVAHTELEQVFGNPHDQPLEATYVFPLPDRAAVTGIRMTAGDRVVEAVLKERGEARADYQRAVAAGRRASIAEEERPDVFTIRVGNILPGERVTLTLTLAGPLSYEDGEASYRFPLVVAPRYVPGEPRDGSPAGGGYAPDTDAVPDASRITPPVLLPGFPHPVRLGVAVTLDPAGLPLEEARASLPVEEVDGGWRVRPGQRADRDFILRIRYGQPVHTSHALVANPDTRPDANPDPVPDAGPDASAGGTGEEGTFVLTVLPPALPQTAMARDVVLVLDRSGSMRGWKMVAARRAAARIIDTLTGADRFAVLTFDTVVERPDLGEPGAGLVAATDRHRFRAVEHLAGVSARGGTELLAPLREALSLLADDGRDRMLVLVTDGQVGNEDQILRETGPALAQVRVHTVGVDQAVNAGFLARLAAPGGGRCELVESEDQLDEAMGRIHRRIGAPLVTGLRLEPETLTVLPGTVTPARLPDLFPGVPLVLTGRYRGRPDGALALRGTSAEGTAWRVRVEASPVDNPALAPVWARAHLRDLEDRWVGAGHRGATPDHRYPRPDQEETAAELESRIVSTSLRHAVLCRFTAYVAVDTLTVTDGAAPHQVVQPVELPAGWKPPAGARYAGRPGSGSAAPASLAMAMPGPAATGGGTGGWARLATGGGRGGRPDALPVLLFAAEAARLRMAATAPERDRRVLLADLASRLDALLRTRHPGRARGGGNELSRLRRLVDGLRGDAALALPVDELDRRWRLILELLDALAAMAAMAAGRAAGPAPGAPRQPPARRRGFRPRA